MSRNSSNRQLNIDVLHTSATYQKISHLHYSFWLMEELIPQLLDLGCFNFQTHFPGKMLTSNITNWLQKWNRSYNFLLPNFFLPNFLPEESSYQKLTIQRWACSLPSPASHSLLSSSRRRFHRKGDKCYSILGSRALPVRTLSLKKIQHVLHNHHKKRKGCFSKRLTTFSRSDSVAL